MSPLLELAGSCRHELAPILATMSSPRSLPTPIPIGFDDGKPLGEDDGMASWFSPWLPPIYWGFVPLWEDCVARDADSILHILSPHHPFCITNWVNCWRRLCHTYSALHDLFWILHAVIGDNVTFLFDFLGWECWVDVIIHALLYSRLWVIFGIHSSRYNMRCFMCFRKRIFVRDVSLGPVLYCFTSPISA
jgi:hypothetical protein